MKARSIIKRIKEIPIAIKSATIYTIASVMTKGLSIITVPIFTRFMTTEEMGTVTVYNTWISNLSVITTFALSSGGFALAMKEFENERDKYVSSILLIPTVSTTFISLIYIIRPQYFQKLLDLPNDLIILMLIGLFVSPAFDFWMSKNKYEYKYMTTSIVSFGMALLASIVSIITVLFLKANNSYHIAEGRLISNNIIVYSISLIIYIYLFYKGKTLYSKRYWKYSLTLSIPLVGYAIANQLLSGADRIMISKILGNSAVGIYGILYTASSLSIIIWDAIVSSFIPYLYQNFTTNRTKIREITDLLLILYAMISLVFTFFAPEIIRIIATKEYFEEINIMPPIICGVFFIAVTNMYSTVLVYYKKTHYMMFSTGISAFVNIILNALFIPKFGIIAASYTTLFSYILLAYIQFIVAKKIEDKEYGKNEFIFNNKHILILSVTVIIISLICIILYQHMLIRYLTILLFIIVISLMIIYIKRKKLSDY